MTMGGWWRYAGLLMLLAGLAWPTARLWAQESAGPGAEARLETLRDQQDQAVALAREGHLAEGLERLRELYARHPRDQYLLFDLITLFHWAREHEQVTSLAARLNPALVPPYVLSGVHRSYGAQGYWAGAETFLAKILRAQRREPELLVTGARLSAESGDPYRATAWLEEAERARAPGLAGQIVEAKKAVGFGNVKDLKTVERVQRRLAVVPGDTAARGAELAALGGLGAPVLARARLGEGGEATAELVNDLQRDAALKEGRWGARTSLTRALDRRSQRLEGALANLAWLEAGPDCLGGCWGGARLAAVRPLAALSRPAEAVRALENVPGGALAAPNELLLTVAGAWLELREPLKAAELYGLVVERHGAGRRVVSEDELYEAEKGLFWARLDADQPSEARAQAQQNFVQGTIAPPEGRALWGEGNWKRADAAVILALSDVYTGRPAAGEKTLTDLLDKAPAHTGALLALSAAKSARGLPRAAWESAATARLHAPNDLGTAVRLAHSLMDVSRWTEAHELVQALGPWAGQSGAVAQLKRRWELFNSFEARASFGFAHTTSRQAVSTANPEDPDIELRLYSPPLAQSHSWRSYLGSAWDSGRFAEGEAQRETFFGGLQYRGPNLEFTLEARDERLDGHRMGAGVEGLWQPTDHWRLRFSAQHNSREAPLRAVHSGIRADSASLGLGYYWHESRALNFSTQYMKFTDSNERLAAGASFSQRLWSAGQRSVTGRLSGYASRNSENDNRPYYNPKQDADAGLGLTYANLLWRGRGKTLRHSLEAGASRYWQKHYGSNLVWTLGYHQSLDWGDRFSTSYGLGYGRRVYDGEPEKTMSGYVNLVWKF